MSIRLTSRSIVLSVAIRIPCGVLDLSSELDVPEPVYLWSERVPVYLCLESVEPDLWVMSLSYGG